MSEPGHWFERDPLWFKTAVFYEIHIRGFFDGNDDGSGDFRGLADKLDYLQWLGIDCLWLLPFYPSPLRDGGYDISDFFSVLPEFGKLGDAIRVVELCKALLFSLPGTPTLYYGDEIGVGDNVFLGGREGVRTPMQWSPDRNA